MAVTSGGVASSEFSLGGRLGCPAQAAALAKSGTDFSVSPWGVCAVPGGVGVEGEDGFSSLPLTLLAGVRGL